MAPITTAFDPLRHGFRFVNAFQFPYLFNISLPLLGPRGIGDVMVGLCGGMCSAALDYFNDGITPVEERDVEKIPLSLFRYLWERQLDTLTTPVMEKLITWSLLSTRALAKKTAEDEIPRLRSELDAGRPVILGLMRSRGLLSLTQNHQVLATGYEFNPASQEMSVQLYDPNHPGRKPELTMNLAGPWRGIKLEQSTGEELRGFFVINYVRKSPPR
jgi:hypothetical protein